MKRVFADTLYWVAITFDHDPWHLQASDARENLGGVTLVTTDEVLVEFLAALSGAGKFYRQQAALMVRSVLEDENVVVLPQSRHSFLDGLSLYERRCCLLSANTPGIIPLWVQSSSNNSSSGT